jgi:hypothetical protein
VLFSCSRLTIALPIPLQRPYGASLGASTAPVFTPNTHQCTAMESFTERVMQAKRRPRRLSVTINNQTYERVMHFAFLQGRSASNLGAYLIEKGVQQLVDTMQP